MGAEGPERPRDEAEVRIRPVRLADLDAIHELRHQPSVLDFTLALSSERLEDNRRFLEHLGPDDHLLVAEADGRVVGTAGLHVKQGKLRHSGVIGMMVHDRYQGRGIGRRLLAALLDLADNQLGLVRVELEVVAANERAIRLYERLGFAHEGRKRQAIRHHGAYADVLLMARLR